VKALGVELDERALDESFERFKALADRKKRVCDADIRRLVEKGQMLEPELAP
jgi:isopropylmalate/homocitrate/citramalate synthase